MAYTPADTPLARFLRARGISGLELARRLDVNQSVVSRAIRNAKCSPKLAVRILDLLDPGRQAIDERYLLLCKVAPHLYGQWPSIDTPPRIEEFEPIEAPVA